MRSADQIVVEARLRLGWRGADPLGASDLVARSARPGRGRALYRVRLAQLVGFDRGGEENLSDLERDRATEAVEALSSLYQADRSDNSTNLSASLALLGANIAYAGVTLAFSDQFSKLNDTLVVLLPIPLWIVAAFHSLIVSAGMLRAVSIQVLERELIRRAKIPDDVKIVVGYQAPEGVMNIKPAAWVHKLAIVLANGGSGLIAIPYTVYILFSREIEGMLRGGALFVYVFVALITALSWTEGLKRYQRNAKIAGL